MLAFVFLFLVFKLSESRVPAYQIYQNYKDSSTGQLSFFTTFLQFAGSAARVATTLVKTGDVNGMDLYCYTLQCRT